VFSGVFIARLMPHAYDGDFEQPRMLKSNALHHSIFIDFSAPLLPEL
jgi:hypothetical protein